MPLKTTADEIPALNLTSLIDVLFLLIIFFMVATNFSDAERDIRLQVPGVSDNQTLTEAPQPKVVNVFADGQISYENQSVSLEELTARLSAARSQYKDTHVVVRGEETTPHGVMARVYNSCTQAGISELGISVKVVGQEK